MSASDYIKIAYFPLSVLFAFTVSSLPCVAIFLWIYSLIGQAIVWVIVPLVILLYALFVTICLLLFTQLRKFYRKLPDGVYSKDSMKRDFGELRTYYYSLTMRLLAVFADVSRFSHIHRLFGAKLGKRTLIGGYLIEHERIEMGENCFLGALAAIIAHMYQGDKYILKKVKIGDNVTIGVGSVIFPGVEIGDNVIIGANTVIPADKKIPSNSVWIGAKPKRLK